MGREESDDRRSIASRSASASRRPLQFIYRQSPQYIEPRDSSGRPAENDPPLNVSGMVRVEMDPEGRLTRFQAVPPQVDSGDRPASVVNWNTLFEAAGLDRSRWTETASQEIPPFGFDARKAWTGTYAHAPNMPLRIEAAAWKGRPVSFELFGPVEAAGPGSAADSPHQTV